jgi:hypothetical protein
MIYIIKCLAGRNFVYVETREEALKICEELPGVFKWEPLELYNGREDQMGHGRQ